MSLWGWPLNPLLGCTRSSFNTRKTPNPVLARLLYSAKEKWNLDLSQLPLVHLGFASLLGLLNHDGLGSLTSSLDLGIFVNITFVDCRLLPRKCQMRMSGLDIETECHVYYYVSTMILWKIRWKGSLMVAAELIVCNASSGLNDECNFLIQSRNFPEFTDSECLNGWLSVCPCTRTIPILWSITAMESSGILIAYQT